MIVTCPSCEAQYILPDDAVSARGRRVKCSSCAYTWLQAPIAEEVPEFVTAAVVEDVPQRPRPLVDTRQIVETPVARGTGRAAMIGIAAALGFFVVTLGFLIVIRNSLAAGWPPSALLFEKVGFSVEAPGTGFVIQDVGAEMKDDVLIVKGKLVNDTAHEMKLPKLLVRISGENGWLKDWPIDLYEKIMPPGESASFEYTLADAPAEGKDVVLRFTD